MSSSRTWHDRPFLAPVVYGGSTFLAGYFAFLSGYLLTGRLDQAVYGLLFIDTLLVLYLLESRRCAKEGER